MSRKNYSKAWDYANEITERYKNGENSTTLSKEYGCSGPLIIKIVRSLDSSIVRSPGETKLNVQNAWKDADNILERYKNNDHPNNIAKHYGCSRSTIMRIIKSLDSNIPKIFSRNKRRSNAWNDKDIILERYKNGESSSSISKDYDCSAAAIIRILRSLDDSIVRPINTHGYYISDAWNDKDIILERYKNGEGSVSISKEYGCSATTIITIIKSIDSSIIRTRGHSKRNTSDAWHYSGDIVERYKNGETTAELCKIYNCSYGTILRIIKSIDSSIVRTRGSGIRTN